MPQPAPRALYVEINPYCVEWLRNLIQSGFIADGDIADFSLAHIRPSDLRRYTQVHFCAGIGLWSYALRGAGWPDSRPCWTASLPCQPFSAAGKGDGFADERHLWPEFFHLVEQCRPEIILGEQVASKDGLTWLDLIQSNMEGAGYTFGSVDSCSAGFGAPHIRQRMYWMAHAEHAERWSQRSIDCEAHGRDGSGRRGDASWVAHAHATVGRTDAAGRYDSHGNDAGRSQGAGNSKGRGESCALAHANVGHTNAARLQRSRQHGLEPSDDILSGERYTGIGHNSAAELARPGPTNGFWRDADWIFCRDGKWRPIEPGTFPLAHGLPRGMGAGGAELSRLASLAGLDAKSLARAKEYRVGSLRAYGNAINADQATDFCVAALEAICH
jgi:DNA (cytosine-5)-methyltransferase 1